MRVMQLHIEELMRQTERRENELQKTQVLLKEHAKQRAVQQPQERKLFARLEQLQAELKTARELRSKAEAHSTDLQQQLEQVVMAAESESDTAAASGAGGRSAGAEARGAEVCRAGSSIVANDSTAGN